MRPNVCFLKNFCQDFHHFGPLLEFYFKSGIFAVPRLMSGSVSTAICPSLHPQSKKRLSFETTMESTGFPTATLKLLRSSKKGSSLN